MDFVTCELCGLTAEAQTPFPLGRDQDGVTVWFRKVVCCGGHWYHAEVREP